MENIKKHYIIRVGDGKNFKNSKYPFWGMKRGGGLKTKVLKINSGDILWFLTSVPYGGNFIGMAEYKCLFDKIDEPFFQINTFTNVEQNWEGPDDWDIQIHYTNLYNVEKRNIIAKLQCSSTLMNYETFIDCIEFDLYKEYKMFKRYAEPKIFS